MKAMLIRRHFILAILLAEAAISDLLYDGRTDAVQEFNVRSFNETVLQDTSHTTWIVVFYADWCSHCQGYAPKFMSLADSFASHFEVVRFGAVDCASSDQSKLGDVDICRDNNVRVYPTILQFRSGQLGEDIPEDITKLRSSIESILKNAGVDHNQTRTDNTAPVASVKSKGSASKPQQQIALTQNPEDLIFDAGLALRTILSEYVFQGGIKTLGGVLTNDVIKLLVLCSQIKLDLVLRQNCVKAADEMRSLTHDVSLRMWRKLLGSHQLGSSGNFKSCKSFSCGMWRLLHLITLSIDKPLVDSPKHPLRKDYRRSTSASDSTAQQIPLNATEAMDSIRFIVDKFFTCKVCRIHFLTHYDSCDFDRCSIPEHNHLTIPFWLWRFHNSVSERVGNPKLTFSQNASQEEVYLKLNAMFFGTDTTFNFPIALVLVAALALLFMLSRVVSVQMLLIRMKVKLANGKYQTIS